MPACCQGVDSVHDLVCVTPMWWLQLHLSLMHLLYEDAMELIHSWNCYRTWRVFVALLVLEAWFVLVQQLGLQSVLFGGGL